MAKENKEKITLLGADNVETSEEVIASDKNTDRRNEFAKTYRKIMQIVPEYFINQIRRRKPSTDSGGNPRNLLTQKIVITQDIVKLETKETNSHEEVKEEDRERED